MPSRKASSSRKKTKDRETFAIALEAYEKAMKHVAKREYEKAASLLEAFVEEFRGKPDVSEVLDRARVHLAVCNANLSPEPAEPESADGWVHQAVALANAARYDEALSSLKRAAELGAPAGRVHYARAAALALADRHDEALEQLSAAIEADPENRAFSLGDPDLERLRETAGYVSLVEPPERPGSAVEEVAAHGNEVLSPRGEGEAIEG